MFQALPASADKLDDVLSRLEAIEKNNAKLANENAALKARLNKVETASPRASFEPATAVSPAVGAVIATRTPTPPQSLNAPEIDANGHGFLEHKKGNPLTFYTPGGEITGYGNIDVSIDDTTKALGGNVKQPCFTAQANLPDRQFRLAAGDLEQQLLSRRARLPAIAELPVQLRLPA